jgi:hypothetical protein
MPPFHGRLLAMKTTLAALLLSLCLAASAQPPDAPAHLFQSLSFLEGTWDAKAQGNGGATASGSYTFRLELSGHILARHSYTAACKGPADYNCEHGDLLYVYPEADKIKAIYFDSEGHVIHYDVTTPESNMAVFLSDGAASGRRFRLTYSLKDAVMSGKFQMQMPGQNQWNSYLEWSGTKK